MTLLLPQVLYSFGSNILGCCGLGHTNPLDSPRPSVVHSLFGWDVVKVTCGNQHVAVLTAEGELLTWGLGELCRGPPVLYPQFSNTEGDFSFCLCVMMRHNKGVLVKISNKIFNS